MGEAMVDMVMVVMAVEVLVGTVMEVMVDMGVETMVDTVMEAMVDTVMEAMVVTVKAAMVVVMGRVATDMVQVMDILGTTAIIVIVHLLIKIMHIHSQDITNHNLTINLKHMPNLNHILKLKRTLNLKHIPNPKHMIVLKHTVSHKSIPTLIHRQLSLKLVIVMVLIINSIRKHKLVIKNLRLRMDFERLMHAFNLQ